MTKGIVKWVNRYLAHSVIICLVGIKLLLNDLRKFSVAIKLTEKSQTIKGYIQNIQDMGRNAVMAWKRYGT